MESHRLDHIDAIPFLFRFALAINPCSNPKFAIGECIAEVYGFHSEKQSASPMNKIMLRKFVFHTFQFKNTFSVKEFGIPPQFIDFVNTNACETPENIIFAT